MAGKRKGVRMIQEIQRLKGMGLGIRAAARTLDISRNTIRKYWDLNPTFERQCPRRVKNAAVVRKNLGYAHIPQIFAREINTFCREHLNPHVNFHRPCFFPRVVTDSKRKGKKSYRYEDMKTPFEKFKSLSCPESFLKPGVTMSQLER